ncbi:MAG: hypothetical protein B6I31_04765 [Desulfobacteraceae bacterium 4572_19]|nr:MAG: hypothetical protein B6I31_04765 [Desulfobacteraceae bacterium 4572_19]
MEKTNQQKALLRDILTGTAVSGFIYAASILLPIIGFFLSLLIPLPTLLYRLKLGRIHGLIIPILVLIIFSLTAGASILDTVFLGELLLLGFITGELIEVGYSIEKTIFFSCITTLLTTVVGVLLYCFASNIGPISLISDYIVKNLELTMALYKSMGMPEENIQLLSDSLKTIEYVLIRVLPALFISSTLFITWINILGARTFFLKKGITLKGYEKLNQWKVPDYLVWTVIASAVLLFLPVSLIKMIGMNGMIILMTIYFFQGIAVVSYFFKKKKFPMLLRVTLYSVIVIQQLIMLLVIGLGFFDTWLNFRKLNVDKR